jgi:SagB-type dehydrogenase family enzyme
MRERFPIAWAFHRNTSRWPYNLLAVPEGASPEAAFKEYPDAPLLPLPTPAVPARPLGDLLAERHSCRRFSDAPLTPAALGTLLGAGFGIRGSALLGPQELLERPFPSGGGLYPLELYPLILRSGEIPAGIYHYSAQCHALEQLRALALPAALVSRLLLGQPYAAHAAVVLVLAAAFERSLHKYADRGYRYVLFEAGHAAQNLNLLAASLDLGCLNLGGFFDSELADLLGLDPDIEAPLYAVAVGCPETSDRGLARQPREG